MTMKYGGVEIVECRYLPDGVWLLIGQRQMAVPTVRNKQDGTIVVFEIPDFAYDPLKWRVIEP